jgi:hypothetical protein
MNRRTQAQPPGQRLGIAHQVASTIEILAVDERQACQTTESRGLSVLNPPIASSQMSGKQKSRSSHRWRRRCSDTELTESIHCPNQCRRFSQCQGLERSD